VKKHTKLKDTKSRRVGDHDACQVVLVLLGLLDQILHVDVAVGVRVDDYDVEAVHGGRGGVGAVSRDGDKADVAVRLANVLVVLLDHAQTSVLTHGARVGLERDGIETSDLAEILLKALRNCKNRLSNFLLCRLININYTLNSSS